MEKNCAGYHGAILTGSCIADCCWNSTAIGL